MSYIIVVMKDKSSSLHFGPGCTCEDDGYCESGECPECRDCRKAGEEIRESCSGCLDNDICDPGECSYCSDCR